MTSVFMTFNITTLYIFKNFCKMRFSIMTLSIMTFGLMACCISTFIIMILSIMTFGLMACCISTFIMMILSIMTFSIMTFIHHYDTQHSDIQYDNIQHYCGTQHTAMLTVTFYNFADNCCSACHFLFWVTPYQLPLCRVSLCWLSWRHLKLLSNCWFQICYSWRSKAKYTNLYWGL